MSQKVCYDEYFFIHTQKTKKKFHIKVYNLQYLIQIFSRGFETIYNQSNSVYFLYYSWIRFCWDSVGRSALREPGSQGPTGGGRGVGQGEEGDPLYRHPRPVPPPGELVRGLGLLQCPSESFRICL